jgi:tetratricopeptide (TPR) repeat protein/tRNA A-37 threonylcarbamoyl transferase component Bud32
MGEEAPELAATLADLQPSRDPKITRAESVQPLEAFPRGSSIGRYLVLDVLGTGGMGVVYTAFDPQLDRKVAIKIVRQRRKRTDSDGPARMLREAQAIARISHPNVVAVHDVGTIEDQVFIAMELVDGETLTAWLRARERSVPEVLDVLIQAGRGLAAAHASGLVHRDFKPDNVLVGIDRTRVVDFGLVREATTTSSADTVVEVRTSQPMLSTPLTQIGVLMGTPMYMSPEQHLQRDADASSDQYSFCASLYEALAGTPPYRGETLADLRARVLVGDPPELPAARRIPPHVAAAVRRGLRVDPATRWPSMSALLAELTRDPAARRRRWLVGAAGAGMVGVVAAAIAIPLAMRDSPEAAPCGIGTAQITAAWGPARSAALRAAFLATQLPYAEASFHAAARQLDTYSGRWAQSHEDSCRATHVRHEQSVEMLDLRTACLQRRRTELSTLVDLMLEPDKKIVARAHLAPSALSPVEECDDLAALQAPSKLPPDPATRHVIEEAREELARIRATSLAGRHKDASLRASALADKARTLAYRPFEAEVQVLIGQVHYRVGLYEESHRAFIAALAAAISSHHDEVLMRALTSLTMVTADKQEFTASHDFTTLANATAERLGNRPVQRAMIHYAAGYALSAEGKFVASVVEYEQAVAIRERIAPGSQDLARALNGLSRAYDEIGRYVDARRLGERSLALQEAELGKAHPEIATVLMNLGNVAVDEGDLALATSYYSRALALREQLARDNDDQLMLANVLNNLGVVAQERGRYDEALAFHQRALAIRETVIDGAPDVAMSISNIANAQFKKGAHAQALANFDKALALAENELGKDHPYVGDALSGMGECFISARNFSGAKQALERALAIRKLGARPLEIADVELALARALWGLGAEHRPRALELARSARTALAASPATKKRHAEAEAFLRTHR